MKEKVNKLVRDGLYYFVVCSLVWVSFSSMIQSFKCPKMTRTEVFLHIPKSFGCDWKECK